jgi:5-methylthioadenosine/S-adenosylhomocysteine deaminase
MLFKNIDILDENLNYIKDCYVGINDKVVDYIGKEIPQKKYDRNYNGKGKLLMPGLVNAHSHASMTLLRGYGENMKLSDWLTTRIFPFEAKLSGEDIYNGAMLGFAEMLRFGIVSVTDMYFMGDYLAKAVLDSGIKCNMSIGITCFDERNYFDLPVFKENNHLIKEYHNIEDEQLKVDISIHAEYTSTPKVVQQIAEFTYDKDLRMHIHLSETKEEHEECKKRHRLTPAQYFNQLGVFDSPTTAAHCIWLEEDDFDIIKEKNVSVASCPVSNLKLASGFCNVPYLFNKGINVAIGTDSVASNNSLNMFEDMKFFALIYKAAFNSVTAITPDQTILAATKNGATSQGRIDCGTIKVGNRADIIVLDTQKPWMIPNYDIKNSITYSTQGCDVVLTMVDGKILYENGQYLSLDIDKVLYNVKKSTSSILSKL